MEKSEVKRILSAPICFLLRSTDEERNVFADKKDGYFYTFKLASGQRFVGYVPEEEEVYTFRPLNNLVPNLKELQWKKTKDISDLGYETIFRTSENTEEAEKQAYREVFVPKPVPAPYLTKLAIQHYAYNPMLERCIWFQNLNQRHKETQKSLLEIQKAKNALLISEEENLIQQKLKERRQNG